MDKEYLNEGLEIFCSLTIAAISGFGMFVGYLVAGFPFFLSIILGFFFSAITMSLIEKYRRGCNFNIKELKKLIKKK